MTALPTVSVVIPAYNAAITLGEAIASICAQTLPDWEMIVVDDGSTDATAAIVHDWISRDPRIRLIRFSHNQGISAAANAGFDNARGAFIARLDSDDRALPERLATQVAAFAANPALAALGSHAHIFGEAEAGIAHCWLGDATLKAQLLRGGNTICGATMMVRGQFVRENHIRFDNALKSAEDIDYLTAVIRAGGQLGNVDQPLVEFRIHATSFTKSRVDTATAGLRHVRQNLLALYYPTLSRADLQTIVDAMFEPHAPHIDVVLGTIHAINTLFCTSPVDYGQDTAVLHTIILDHLTRMAAVFRQAGLLNGSHGEALRHFVDPRVVQAIVPD